MIDPIIKEKNKKRIVLTGGPCCGKTTTIDEIRRRGHNVLDETARVVIQEGVYHPSKNVEEFQNEILRRQILQEDQTSEIAFLDRSALDGVAYSLLFLGKIPKEFSNHNLTNRYDLVFLLDRFALKNDGIRVENSDEEAQKIHDMIHHVYSLHGYSPIRVPIMPIEDRVGYILNHVERNERGCE